MFCERVGSQIHVTDSNFQVLKEFSTFYKMLISSIICRLTIKHFKTGHGILDSLP